MMNRIQEQSPLPKSLLMHISCRLLSLVTSHTMWLPAGWLLRISVVGTVQATRERGERYGVLPS